MRALLFIFFACAPQSRALMTITSVDRPLSRVTEELLQEIDTEAHASIFERGPGGYHIVQDTNFIAERSKQGTGSWGLTIEERIILPQMGIGYQDGYGRWMWLPEDRVKDVLAHELGHAMGLSHADHGIMQTDNWECVGTEAACLVEALKEQGALK